MAKLPLIAVSTPRGKHIVPKGSAGKLDIGLYFSPDGNGVISDGSNAVLAVYDLELYLSNQAKLAEAAQTGGLHEVNEAYFVKERQIPFDLAGHKVEPGSGVLFVAQVTFVKKPRAAHGTAWAIAADPQRDEHEKLGFSLAVGVESQTSGGFEQIAIGQAGLADSDLDEFLKTGLTERKLAVRLLSVDLKQVLLSNLNPDTSNQGTPKRIYCVDTPVKGEAAQQFALRRQTPDLTGTWVEDAPSDRARRQRTGEPLFDEILLVRGPAVLYVQQAGFSTVGWYVPLDEEYLKDRDVFDANIRKEMLASGPRCIMGVHKVQFDPTALRFLISDPKRPHVTLFGEGARDPRELDPLDLLNELHRPELLRTAKSLDCELQEELGGLIQRLVIREHNPNNGSGGNREWTFVRLNESTRLPNIVLRESLRNSEGIVKFRQELHQKLEESRQQSVSGSPDIPTLQQIMDAMTLSARSPVTPGVMAALATKMVSAEMRAVLGEWMDGNKDDRRRIRVEISSLLKRIMFSFRPTERTLGMVQCKRLATERGFIHTNEVHRYWSVLEEVVGHTLKSLANKPEPSEDELRELYRTRIAGSRDLDGFAFWEIGAVQRFEYSFEFTELSVSASLGPLVGSLGGFFLTVTARDRVDGRLLWMEPAKFVGGFLGGGLGVKYSLILGRKGKGGAAATGGTVSCTLKSHLELVPEDFHYATFNTMALLKPSAHLDFKVGTLGNNWHETIFGVTLFHREPTTHLEAVVTGDFFDIQDKVTLQSVAKYLKAWKDAITSGKLDEVPLPSINAVLGAVTLSVGVLVPWGEIPDVKDVYEVPDHSLPVQSLDIPFQWQIQAAGFQSGKHHLLPNAVYQADHLWAMYRKLLENATKILVDGSSSPEWGQLGRKQATTENINLSRRRAESVLAALKASVGDKGEGILRGDVEFKPRGHGATKHKQTTNPADESPGTILDPFCNAALDQNNAAARARLRRESGLASVKGTDEAGVYRYLRRVDVQLAGLIALRIVQQPFDVTNVQEKVAPKE